MISPFRSGLGIFLMCFGVASIVALLQSHDLEKALKAAVEMEAEYRAETISGTFFETINNNLAVLKAYSSSPSLRVSTDSEQSEYLNALVKNNSMFDVAYLSNGEGLVQASTDASLLEEALTPYGLTSTDRSIENGAPQLTLRVPLPNSSDESAHLSALVSFLQLNREVMMREHSVTSKNPNSPLFLKFQLRPLTPFVLTHKVGMKPLTAEGIKDRQTVELSPTPITNDDEGTITFDGTMHLDALGSPEIPFRVVLSLSDSIAAANATFYSALFIALCASLLLGAVVGVAHRRDSQHLTQIIDMLVGLVSGRSSMPCPEPRNQRYTELAQWANTLRSEFLRRAQRFDDTSTEQQRFLAMMTRQTHTPLTDILLLADLLKLDSANDLREQQLAQLSDSARQLKEISEDIATYSELDTGELDLSVVPFNLTLTMQSILKQHRMSGNAPCLLSIDSEVPSSLVGDPTTIRRVVSSLLHDLDLLHPKAAEFTLAVNAKEQSSSNTVELTVSVGTSKAFQWEYSLSEHVLTPYYESLALSERTKGAKGMDLAVVIGLINILDGHLLVESAQNQVIAYHFTFNLRRLASSSNRELTPPQHTPSSHSESEPDDLPTPAE